MKPFWSPSIGVRSAIASLSLRFAWPICLGGLVSFCILGFFGILVLSDGYAAGKSISAELVIEESRTLAQRAGPAERQPLNYVAMLPQATPVSKLLNEVLRTCRLAGVAVVGAEPQDGVAAAPNELPRTILVLRLQGRYPHIKKVFMELLARFPGLTLQQLRVQQISATEDSAQEATVTLVQWLRPVQVAPSITQPRPARN